MSAAASNSSQKSNFGKWFWGFAIGLILLGAIAAGTYRLEYGLGEPALVSGYSLFTIIVLLMLFNMRKKLSMLPMVRAYWWLVVHTVLGLLALGVYWLHVGTLWPNGASEQALALAFYWVSVSGILGFFLEKAIPKRLAQLDREFIFERIPFELSSMREKVEHIVLEAAKTTGNDTLGRYYAESLEWFFRRPRFISSHLWGSTRADSWVTQHVEAMKRYLSDEEKNQLAQLYEVALAKNQLDAHYALQGVMKVWLLFHVPVAFLLLVLALWHLLIVNIYLL